jgi:hypothetical protein
MNMNRFGLTINTTFENNFYTRWCCIDRLSPQRLPVEKNYGGDHGRLENKGLGSESAIRCSPLLS